MSLINKMLRDLDERHASPVDRAELPSHLRPLPPEPGKSALPVALALAALAAAAGVVLWPAEPPVAVVVPTSVAVANVSPPPPKPSPAPASAAVVEPVAPPPLDNLIAPPSAGSVEPPAVAIRPAASSSHAESAAGHKNSTAKAGIALRLETNLPDPGGKPAAKAVAEPAKPAVAAASTPASAATPALVPATVLAAAGRAAPVPEAVAESTSIDKRLHGATANEGAESAYRKAMAALRRGAMAEAVDGLRAALRSEPQHVLARQALLSVLIDQQHWGETQSLLEEGLALDPAQTGWALALARLQLEHARPGEALETLLRHAKHADQNAEYQAFLALLLQKQKRSREAAERYRAALALKPAESRWWFGLGLVLESAENPQGAREAFARAKETGNLAPELAAAVEQRLR